MNTKPKLSQFSKIIDALTTATNLKKGDIAIFFMISRQSLRSNETNLSYRPKDKEIFILERIINDDSISIINILNELIENEDDELLKIKNRILDLDNFRIISKNLEKYEKRKKTDPDYIKKLNRLENELIDKSDIYDATDIKALIFIIRNNPLTFKHFTNVIKMGLGDTATKEVNPEDIYLIYYLAFMNRLHESGDHKEEASHQKRKTEIKEFLKKLSEEQELKKTSAIYLKKAEYNLYLEKEIKEIINNSESKDIKRNIENFMKTIK